MNELLSETAIEPMDTARIRCVSHRMNLAAVSWLALHEPVLDSEAVGSEDDSETDSEFSVSESAERWLERMRERYPVSDSFVLLAQVTPLIQHTVNADHI